MFPRAPSAHSPTSAKTIKDLIRVRVRVESCVSHVMSDSIQLRISLLNRLTRAWSSLQPPQLTTLILSTCLSLFQIITSLVLLAITATPALPQCRDERLFLALHLTRLIIALPPSLYLSLVPPPPSRNPSATTPVQRPRHIGSPLLDLKIIKLANWLTFLSIPIFIWGNIVLLGKGARGCREGGGKGEGIWWGSLVMISVGWIYIAEVSPPSFHSMNEIN